MNTTDHHAPVTPPEVGGVGHRIKRHEDDRLIQGAGNFVDHIVLLGMLHMAFVRSPLAHATINSIDTSATEAIDGVLAVVTGELLAGYNLAWMPTMSGDTQAVLATDKVRFQGQEVAAVIATDPYIARDGADAVHVDGDPLPVITSPQQGIESDAPIIRTDKEDKTDNFAYEWGTGDDAAKAAAFANADRVVTLETHYPRSHPSPLETRGIVADVNPTTGQATLYNESLAETAIDPVCGMTVTVADARWITEHDGDTYYFCAPGCQTAFESDPAQFLSVSS
jgi:carbon-monoxide dehydrogenase large subunit